MPPPKVTLTGGRREQATAPRKRLLLHSGTEAYQDSKGLGEQWSYMGSCPLERLQKPMHNPIFSKVRSRRKQIFSWTSLLFWQCGWEMVNRKNYPPFFLPSLSPVSLQAVTFILTVIIGKNDVKWVGHNYKEAVTEIWTALGRWNAWSPVLVLSHTLGNSRHDPKPLRCEQFSDSYNKPFLSSAGRKNRQTLKLRIHFQWIIWSPVTFVWHNLHAIHKLILPLMLQNQQIYNKWSLPHNPAGRKLAGLLPQCTGLAVRARLQLRTYEDYYSWACLHPVHEHKELTESPVAQGQRFQNPSLRKGLH